MNDPFHCEKTAHKAKKLSTIFFSFLISVQFLAYSPQLENLCKYFKIVYETLLFIQSG